MFTLILFFVFLSLLVIIRTTVLSKSLRTKSVDVEHCVRGMKESLAILLYQALYPEPVLQQTNQILRRRAPIMLPLLERAHRDIEVLGKLHLLHPGFLSHPYDPILFTHWNRHPFTATHCACFPTFIVTRIEWVYK